MPKGKSKEYYDKNPESKAKKNAYNKEFNKKPEQKKKRADLNKINRDKGTYGNKDGKDYDHATKKMVKQSVNRGRNSKNGGTKGDIKARG